VLAQATAPDTESSTTQPQNRAADRGPQPGSPAGVVVATG